MFERILVANRGEIARRIIRTCRARGIESAVVYSEADAAAPHVWDADRAVCVGPAPARSSYLRVDAVIEAARSTGCDAIHPGYGFLSENAELARACEAAGLVFIGPTADAIAAMGDKIEARRRMVAAGVPVVPGRDDVSGLVGAERAVEELGLPVLLKASAGGGGKGMRLVERASELEAAYESAAREALAAFGNGALLVERALTAARHVEIQVLADTHGNVVHLGERDCSVQRRHQKIIEESPCPSPQMSPEVRAAMGAVAVRAASSVGYVGAGTVEFLFEEGDDGPSFYFLEMNTRLQVEHPITEATTGRDLVWDQIRIAHGEPLGLTQSDVSWRGHAFECRVYAEDPVAFLPRPGRISAVRWPQGGRVRVDAAVVSGSEVSSFYDPLVAKIVTWGDDRAAALAEMRRVFDELAILGVETNIPLHRAILREPDFARGHRVSTRYLETHPGLVPRPIPPPDADTSRAIAAAAAVDALHHERARAMPHPPTVSTWRRANRWRS